MNDIAKQAYENKLIKIIVSKVGDNNVIFSPFFAGITAHKNDVLNKSCCHIQQIHNDLYYPRLLSSKNNKCIRSAQTAQAECSQYFNSSKTIFT